MSGGREAARGRAAGERVWILTCEHASCAVPREYRSLGLARAELRDHIGWDLGAQIGRAHV